jgi:ABC-2 type transport system permease protein
MASGFAEGMLYTLKPLDIAVLIGELIISILVFLLLYRRNGYEKD